MSKKMLPSLGIFAALVVPAPLAAAVKATDPIASTNESPAASQADTYRALVKISEAINSKARPAADNGCADGLEVRSSDLCAQWKAADAAADAARYALLGLLATTVATILLVLTLIQSGKTSQRELRAYLSINTDKMYSRLHPDGSRRFEIITKMLNGGATPAYNVVLRGGIGVISPDRAEMVVQKATKIRRGLPHPVTIHHGGESKSSIVSNPLVSERQIADVKSGRRNIYYYGSAEYTDAFNFKRQTHFCLYLDGEALEFWDRVGAANAGKMMPGAEGPDWKPTPFHNSAT